MRSVSAGVVLAVSVLVTAGCSSPNEAVSSSSAASSPPPGASSSPPSESGAPLLGVKEAARQFLAIVCPTDTALHLVETVQLSKGSWQSVKPKDVQPYTRNAVEAARTTSQELERTDWPENVASIMPEVSREYLEILAPLDSIDQAASGAAMQRPWKELQSLSRVAEQQVRVSLGLGTAGSKEDGCPPPPKVEPTQEESGGSADPAQPAVPTDYRTRLCTTSPGALPAVTPGESSSDVKLLQWALAQLGYYRGAIGGNYGDLTYEATYAFQLDNDLGRTAPGSVAVNTWSWLQNYLC